MPTLAFDTATSAGVVAVLDGTRAVTRRSGGERARHGETLLPMIQEALAEASVSLRDVDLLAVGAGPGSFTGLRIGLATAQGLRLASGVASASVCTLQAMAAPHLAPGEAPVAAVLDAFRGEVYVAVYAPAAGDGGHVDRPEVLVEPFSATPEVAAARLAALPAPPRLVGDGLAKYGELMVSAGEGALAVVAGADSAPSAVHIGRHAEALRAAGAIGQDALQPIYLRGADAKLPDVPLRL